jgi:hypothetical protein
MPPQQVQRFLDGCQGRNDFGAHGRCPSKIKPDRIDARTGGRNQARGVTAFHIPKRFVIPEKSLFLAFRQENAILSGIQFGLLPKENQIGFRINFLSPCCAGRKKVYAE